MTQTTVGTPVHVNPGGTSGSGAATNSARRRGPTPGLDRAVRMSARKAQQNAPRDVRNATPCRLHITNTYGETLVLAPLESRALDADEQRWPWAGLLRRGIVVRDASHDAVRRTGEPKPRSRRGVHVAALLCTLAISAAAPIAAYFAGLIPTATPVVTIAFIVAATMLPGLLFFLFDRQRLSTLRDRFERQIFRLDPNVATLADVEARYGSQMDEVFFPRNEKTTTVSATQRLWPIIVATEAIALGWIMALRPNAGESNPELYEALADPLAFAFLGAYFFSLNMCLRRYARNDLRPKAYSAITVRVITVVVLAWLVQAIAEVPAVSGADTDAYRYAVLPLAFVVGVLPETAMVALRDTLQRLGKPFNAQTSSLTERLPLTDLEGLDLYDRARLIDEGVANIEALAHHDLVDLMLETRIPASRLVDWMDQSILYLHLNAPDSDDQKKAESHGRRVRANLRDLGIRTATDLIVAAQKCSHRDTLADAFDPDDMRADGDDRLSIFLAAICDDEWMSYVRTWRDRTVVPDRYITLDDTGEIADDDRTSSSCDPAPRCSE